MSICGSARDTENKKAGGLDRLQNTTYNKPLNHWEMN